MNIMLNNYLLQAAASGGVWGSLGMFLPLIAVFIIFYFLMIRPEQKKQKAKEKARKEMLASLAKNDKVVTIGGINGTVVNVKDKTVIVKVDENTKLEFNREAISEVIDRKKRDEEAGKSADSTDSAEVKK
jgi:preprotein translocase subunit YajC